MLFPEASEQRAAELDARFEAWLLQRPPTLGAGEECSAIWSANVIATSLEGDLRVLVEQLEAYPASRAQQTDGLRVVFADAS